MALPSGYTPLEYIESTGTQYIDTGFKPNQDTRLVLDFHNSGDYSGMTTGLCPLFGVRNASSSGVFAMWIGTTSYPHYGNVAYNKNGSFTTDLNARLIYELNKNVASIGDTSITCTSATFTTNYNLCLLTVNNYGTIESRRVSGKTYSCQIYDNGILVRDYIPVQRLDGMVGLLDQVNNVFYPDAAGGNFILGPLAAKPEAPASLEVIGTTRNAAVLAWPGVPVGQRYRLYRDGVMVYEGSNLCYTDAGLAAGSAHAYSVHTLSGFTESEGVTTEATTTENIVLITDRTAADVFARRRKGYYNALDLIRVGEAMAYLEERFAAVGISVTVSPKLDWQLADIPTHAQALHYLTDIGVLRGKLTEFRDTVSLPGSLTALTWGRANDIEVILLDTEKLIRDIILSYRHYSGRTISGVNALP